MGKTTHRDELETMLFRLADVADALTLPVWTSGDIEVVTKPDGSPVTPTDVAVETAIRAVLADELPHDGFLGEEVGATPGQSGRTWIVDGIDGTRAFTSERPEWSTLIALVSDGCPICGIVTSPALERRWYSSRAAEAAVSRAGSEPERLSVSSHSQLAGARIARWPFVSAVKPAFRDEAERIANLMTSADEAIRPSWNSQVPNGAMLVADGRSDAFVMFGGQPWDHAAPAAIVTASGGRFSCLEGTNSLVTGAGVYSNGAIHDELLAALAGPRTSTS